MTVLLLTGPPAAGKNATAELVARRVDRCAVIDVDLVRRMIVHPRLASWQGEEGARQHRLGAENACAIARNLHDEGFSVVMVDIVTPGALEVYRERLGPCDLRTIQLLPSEAEIAARMLSRPDYLSRGEVSALYDQQSRFTDYDDKLDNTAMDPEAAADWLLERWLGPRP